MLAVAQHRAGIRWPDLVVAGIGPPDPPRAGGLTFHTPLASAHVPSTVATLQFAAVVVVDLEGRERHRLQARDLAIRQFHPGRTPALLCQHDATLTADLAWTVLISSKRVSHRYRDPHDDGIPHHAACRQSPRPDLSH